MSAKIEIASAKDLRGGTSYRVFVSINGAMQPPRIFQSLDDAERFAEEERLRFEGGDEPGRVSDATHWRARADDARALADLLADGEVRRRMIADAAGYDRLAKRAGG
jgi:hypothetical protein